LRWLAVKEHYLVVINKKNYTLTHDLVKVDHNKFATAMAVHSSQGIVVMFSGSMESVILQSI
jgi:hypothetical protein